MRIKSVNYLKRKVFLMKRVLKKAIAFISALAVSVSMAVGASAASSAGTRVVKNAAYKKVVATDNGIFFTNFSYNEIESGSASKSVLCVTPNGEKTKVKVKNSTKVTSSNLISTGSVYFSCIFPNYLEMSYYDSSTYSTAHQIIFSNGKTLDISASEKYYLLRGASDYSKYYIEVVDSVTSNGSYESANYTVYDENGKVIFSTPYSALKNAPGDFVEMVDYEPTTSSALFSGYYDPDTQTYPIWLVQDKKTVATFKGTGAEFVKNSKGETAIAIRQDDNYTANSKKYYSVKTGKQIKNFTEQLSYSNNNNENYSVDSSSSKYVVKNKAGKKIYSISKSKVAGYYIYDESVAIITKSGTKYGLVLVK